MCSPAVSTGLSTGLSTGRLSSQWSGSYANDWPDFTLTKKDIFAFKRLIEEPIVQQLLNWDKCCLLADKYLLAMALTYFKRAGLRHQQFTPVYLMVALYLAHDMEEDDLDIKLDLVRFAMSDSVSDSKLRLFLRKRDKLWHQMGLRSAVNHICCEAIMRYCLPEHKIWRRERAFSHGGVCLPQHVKRVVHRELRLSNSYVECNIRCIVCQSHYIRQNIKRTDPQTDKQTDRSNRTIVKPFFSTLSALSAPFFPQNYYINVPNSEE